VGAWGYTTEFEDLSRTSAAGEPVFQRGTYGVYTFGERSLYLEEDCIQGLSVFARAGIADSRVNVIKTYLGGGTVYRGLFPDRDRDRLGCAVAAAQFSSEWREVVERETDDWEIALELTYRAILTPWLSLQPDLQYVINPGGDPALNDALVVGIRGVLSF
jgi:porin